MFTKILIANRGEIACRVVETAQKLGVATVAVYSDADATARHVAVADEAMHIGGSAPADSYLKGDRIIEAALAAGAEAIHPGYGFLSENPDFVETVEAAGLIFIGPSSKVIRAMGLKDAAKALMEHAGVPVVPGYHGADQDEDILAGRAAEIGYPVLIKAVAGGGGKGMRLVTAPEAFAAALASARSEAKTAFGNGDVLVEKYVNHPRHIEIQIFGDGVDAVHLFERDCSLQRRHQKVIEEAPAPGMTDDMRAAMGQAAVRAAKAIGYKGAGTIEFIVDASDGLRSDRFWFMEMNTRLQVEHPVTEAITGVDLVEWQLRVAAGEALPMAQEDLRVNGHAFEARIYAEDVPGGFLPATGHLKHVTPPATARFETGIRAGDEISPWYDPMIAKLIVHGPSRGVALSRLTQALETTQIAGSVTNLQFLARLAAHHDVQMGNVDTGLIERDVEQLVSDAGPGSDVLALAAIGTLGCHNPLQKLAGFCLWGALEQTAHFLHGDREVLAAVAVLDPEKIRVDVDGQSHELTRDGAYWRVDGQGPRASIISYAGGVSVFSGGGFDFFTVDPLARGGEDEATGGVTAPMPGVVKSVLVSAGQTVEKGAPLAVLEAMKMEHTLRAPQDGCVASVFVTEGTQIEAGKALLAFEEGGDK